MTLPSNGKVEIEAITSACTNNVDLKLYEDGDRTRFKTEWHYPFTLDDTFETGITYSIECIPNADGEEKTVFFDFDD